MAQSCPDRIASVMLAHHVTEESLFNKESLLVAKPQCAYLDEKHLFSRQESNESSTSTGSGSSSASRFTELDDSCSNEDINEDDMDRIFFFDEDLSHDGVGDADSCPDRVASVILAHHVPEETLFNKESFLVAKPQCAYLNEQLLSCRQGSNESSTSTGSGWSSASRLTELDDSCSNEDIIEDDMDRIFFFDEDLSDDGVGDADSWARGRSDMFFFEAE